MKPAKKSLVYLGGKMRFEFWPLWQCWAVWPIQILFSRQGRLKIFLAGFIKYLNFRYVWHSLLDDVRNMYF